MDSSSVRQRFDELTRPLKLDDSAYQEVMKRMNEHMDCGLSQDRCSQADIKMYITYVRSIPNGKEVGDFLALDLGGTNFRVLLIRVNGADVQMENTIYMVPEEVMVGSGEQLFDHIAGCIESFVKDHQLNCKTDELPLGFTFSFPCKQEGLAKARLVQWTKGFTASGVEGEDIVTLLHHSVEKKGMKVRCVAVINDTVGALMSCAHEEPTCQIGLILGTGTNACFMEKLDRVKQWDGDSEDPRQVIINTEWGAFGNSKCLDFITTDYDRNVDQLSKNPGRQIYEKMISGMYMGEITRQVIIQLVEAGCLFNGEMSEKILQPMSFYTKYLSEIESEDNSLDNYKKTRQVLEELDLLNSHVSDSDCKLLHELCQIVSSRAAYLAAAGIAVLLARVDKQQVTVAVDGSLYRYHPRFHDLITEKVTQLVPNRKFKLMLSNDGSGKGAALVAAVACRLLTSQD